MHRSEAAKLKKVHQSMSKTMPLHVEQEKQLIDYFRDNPSLWCKTHRDYNNRSVRSEKLEEIARQLGLNRKWDKCEVIDPNVD